MSQVIRVREQSLGSNTIPTKELDVKTIRVDSSLSHSIRDAAEDLSTGDVDSSQERDVQELSAAERRAKRREEYKEAASIQNRAIQMQKKAEERLRQTESLAALMNQAKEDPTILAKALNLSPEDFQRKIFNKMYSIKEDLETEEREETFEEETRRKLREYEEEKRQDRLKREQEEIQRSELNSKEVKYRYIEKNILPVITDEHEFIVKNDKEACASMVYDLMNQAFGEHSEKGGTEEDFELKAIDVIDQLEEELEKRAEQQILEARSISKLKKYFSSEEEGFDRGDEVSRKSFSSVSKREIPSSSIGQRRVSSSRSTTLSNSFGSGATPALSSSSSDLNRRISFSNKEARRAATKRILGANQ